MRPGFRLREVSPRRCGLPWFSPTCQAPHPEKRKPTCKDRHDLHVQKRSSLGAHARRWPESGTILEGATPRPLVSDDPSVHSSGRVPSLTRTQRLCSAPAGPGLARAHPRFRGSSRVQRADGSVSAATPNTREREVLSPWSRDGPTGHTQGGSSGGHREEGAQAHGRAKLAESKKRPRVSLRGDRHLANPRNLGVHREEMKPIP